jgi:hypothetical protein
MRGLCLEDPLSLLVVSRIFKLKRLSIMATRLSEKYRMKRLTVTPLLFY